MKQYKLIARHNKRYDIVTVCILMAYVEKIKQACEKYDKKRTDEIIEVDSTNQ